MLHTNRKDVVEVNECFLSVTGIAGQSCTNATRRLVVVVAAVYALCLSVSQLSSVAGRFANK